MIFGPVPGGSRTGHSALRHRVPRKDSNEQPEGNVSAVLRIIGKVVLTTAIIAATVFVGAWAWEKKQTEDPSTH